MILTLFVLTSVFCCISADVYKMNLIKIQSKMVQMIREGVWAAHINDRNTRHSEIVRLLRPGNSHSQQINDYYDMEYVGNITVGTPPQQFRVALDTATADSWVVDYTCSAGKPLICDESICDQGLICEVFCPSKVCCEKVVFRKANPCRGKQYFDSKKSSTYTPTKIPFRIGYYRNKAIVFGMIGNDTVGFGNAGDEQLSVPGTFIGQTYKIHDYFAGSMGSPKHPFLRPPATLFGRVVRCLRTTDSGTAVRHPIDGVIGMAFSDLSYNGFIPPMERAGDLGIVEPMFTVYMKLVGGKAENVYGGTITYGGVDREHCSERISYYPISTASYWKFKVDSFAMGSYSYKRRVDAISDTASSFIGAAYPFMADQIAEKVGAKYSKEHDLYYIDCKANVSTIITIGKENFTVEAENLIIQVDESICILALYGYQYFWGSVWILGTPFLRQYCTVYDIGNERIGFAKSLQM